MSRPARIPTWCIGHPIATTLLAAAAVLLGIFAFPMLPVASLPEAEFPTIQIKAFLPGAGPETMASAVASPLETELSAIPGITEMASTSSLGNTVIRLQFTLDKSIDTAAQEVQAAINTAAGRLPSDMPSLPVWRKVNPADSPVLVLGLSSPYLPLTELSDLAETVLARQLSQIQGVAEVSMAGQQKPAIRIQAAPERLASLGLTLADLRHAVQQASANQAKGALFGPDRLSMLASNDQIFSPAEYDELVVAWRNGAPVRLGDVASVSFGAEDAFVQAWTNGEPGIAYVIRRQPGANVVATADRVLASLPQLRESLPAHVELEVLNDRTRTIRASLHEVELTLVLTVMLVVAVMGAFLRQLAGTLIVGAVLCVALVATFAAMYALGFSLNNLTLVALVIAVGFVVDDAIVVVENIHRELEAGKPVRQAALDGTAQITTLAAMLGAVPLALALGTGAELRQPLGLAVIGGLLVSQALTLYTTPVVYLALDGLGAPRRPPADGALPRASFGQGSGAREATGGGEL